MKAAFKDTLNVTHQLPKLTPALNRRIDSVKDMDDDDACRTMYDIMVEVMGTDSASKAFDADTYDECDVMAVSTCFSRMCHAYQAPLMEEQAAQTARMVNQLPIDKIVQMSRISEQA